MRNYRVESLDPRDDSLIHIDTVNADLFIVDDNHVTVTFFVENSNSSMTPVAMIPFKYVTSILPDFTTELEKAKEGDSE